MVSFEIKETEHKGFPVIIFEGYCAKAGAAALEEKLEEILSEGKNKIIIDLSRCSILSSPGLAILLNMVMEIFDDYKGQVNFVGLDKVKEHLMNMVGVLPIAGSFPNLEEAGAAMTE